MKDWTGVLIFIAIAIANIFFEQQAQRKKRASSEETPDAAPAARRRKPESSTEADAYSSPPHEPTLQETLQSLFENRNLEPRMETPPSVPEKTETPPAPAPILAQKYKFKVPAVPATPPAPPAPPIPKSLGGAVRKPASAWLTKADFRSRKSLRRAVVMAEVLGRPKGL